MFYQIFSAAMVIISIFAAILGAVELFKTCKQSEERS